MKQDLQIDDTRDGLDTSPSMGDLKLQVADLMRFRTDRNDSYAWAKDLKLLAWDDFDEEGASPIPETKTTSCVRCATESDEDREALAAAQESQRPLWACNRCETRYRLQERFHCSICNGGDFDLCSPCRTSGAGCDDSEHRLSYTPEICEHLARKSCRRCILTPPFPSAGEVTSFRIVRQSQLPIPDLDCTHVVAVSYCWPVAQDGQTQGRYRVRNEDGTVRPNRAPEQIIQRAVAFARESGSRFVWIDQECIDQVGNENEKALAVESMDLVYSRADTSIALLGCPLDAETQLYPLWMICYWGQAKLETPGFIGTQLEIDIWRSAESVIGALETISRERWGTRAWVLQEAFSAGSKMYLLFPPANPEEKRRIVSNEFLRTDLASSDYAVSMDYFARCVDWAREIFMNPAPQRLKDANPGVDQFTKSSEARIADLFRDLRVRIIQPRIEQKGSPRLPSGHYKRSSNAACALSFLRHRDCYFVRDRASIFANLCDYDYRLDMDKVCEAGYPLSAALLALSILNGDFSLFIPEVYERDDPETMPGFENVAADFQPFPTRSQLQSANYWVANPSWTAPQQATHFFSMGSAGQTLAFPGMLWKVDDATQRIDCTRIRKHHGEAWTLALFYTDYYRHVIDGGEDLDKFLAPYISFFQRPDIEIEPEFDRLRDELGEAMTLGSGLWAPQWDRRALRLEKEAIAGSVCVQLAAALRASSELALADAVWNSVQGPSWPIDDVFRAENDVPASMADFPHELPKDVRVDGLVELEPDGKGGWLQAWLVRRVMVLGYVTYGKLVYTTDEQPWPSAGAISTGEGQPEIGKEEEEEKEKKNMSDANENSKSETKPEQYGQEQTGGNTQSEQQKQPKDDNDEADHDSRETFRRRYLRQLVDSMIASQLRKLFEDQGHKTNRDRFVDDPGSYSLLTHVASTRFKGKAEDLGERRAFFDVSESCFVLTPYNTGMDYLPRPETRAMSTSWVVAPHAEASRRVFEETGVGSDQVQVLEAFRATRAVRGMWAVGYHPTTRYALVLGEPSGEVEKVERDRVGKDEAKGEMAAAEKKVDGGDS